MRLNGTNKVVTSIYVSFCAYPFQPWEVRVLPEDEHRVPDAVITTPANDEDIRATLNVPVVTEIQSIKENTSDSTVIVSEIITVPAHAAKVIAGTTTHTYRPGAKVGVNWRGHGEYYSAIVTGVHEAGTNGSRTTYDVIYESDGEAEKRVSSTNIRPRGNANVAVETGPCGQALVTDCHPAYLPDVPDLARANVTPTNYRDAARGPERGKWTKSIQNELESLRRYMFVNELPDGQIALRCLWVYKVKCGPNGEVTRYKSRLTVNGKSQRYGIDYTKTFSPVAFATSIRLLFALGIASNFVFRQYDIKCAFLYADLPKEQQVYMYSPPGAERKGYWL